MRADGFPSSAAFDEIARSLSSSDADRKDAIKTGNAIFAFTLKNSAGTQESWYIDLKETGTVGKGAAPEGKKAAVTLVLSDADFEKLVQGKANAQKLFMSGKLKVKGDVMKVRFLGGVWVRVNGILTLNRRRRWNRYSRRRRRRRSCRFRMRDGYISLDVSNVLSSPAGCTHAQ
jgi:putative sterol carrier protein